MIINEPFFPRKKQKKGRLRNEVDRKIEQSAQPVLHKHTASPMDQMREQEERVRLMDADPIEYERRYGVRAPVRIIDSHSGGKPVVTMRPKGPDGTMRADTDFHRDKLPDQHWTIRKSYPIRARTKRPIWGVLIETYGGFRYVDLTYKLDSARRAKLAATRKFPQGELYRTWSTAIPAAVFLAHKNRTAI